MSQQDYKSASIVYNGWGCLVFLIFLGIINAGYLEFSGANRNSLIMYKVRQSEAKRYVSFMNKAQQANFAEKSAFANSFDALGLGIKTETPNYKYSVLGTTKAVFNYGVPKKKDLKIYVGGVFVVPAKNWVLNADKDEITTTSILCGADSPGTIKPAEPTYQNGKLVCGKGTTEVTK